MRFREWLTVREDSGINALSLSLDIDKKPMHLTDPLKKPPADYTGEKIEKGFGVKRRAKAASKLFVANDKASPRVSNINSLPPT